jgi:transcription elongation factor GreB
MDSPLAKALLGKQQDDEVIITLPTGKKHYFIISIRY